MSKDSAGRREIRLAYKSVAEMLDCLEGIASEQGLEGLSPFSRNPEAMISGGSAAARLLRSMSSRLKRTQADSHC